MFCPLQSSYYIWSFVCCDLHEGQDMLYNAVGIVMPQGACMMLQIQEVVEQQCPAAMGNESTIVCHAVWLPDSTSRWEHLLLSLGLNVSNLLLPEVSRRRVQIQHASIHVGTLCLHDLAIVARHSDRMHGSSAMPQTSQCIQIVICSNHVQSEWCEQAACTPTCNSLSKAAMSLVACLACSSSSPERDWANAKRSSDHCISIRCSSSIFLRKSATCGKLPCNACTRVSGTALSSALASMLQGSICGKVWHRHTDMQ